MNTKWSFAVILSLSALFGTQLRAGSTAYGFRELTANTDLSASMRSNATSAFKNLGSTVDIAVPKWIFADAKRIELAERALETVASGAFTRSIREFSTKCRTRVREIHLETSEYISFDSITFDINKPELTKTIDNAANDCESIYATVDDANRAIAPRKLSVLTSEIVRGNVTAQDAVRWAAEIKSERFRSVMRDFEDSCKRTNPKVELGSRTLFMSEILAVPAHDGTDQIVGRLQDIANNCRQIIPATAEFNTKLALPHGLLFRVDFDTISGDQVMPDQVKAWYSYFATDPRRLDGFRTNVIKSSKALSNSKKNAVVQVSVSTYWKIFDPNRDTSLLSQLVRVVTFTQIPAYLMMGRTDPKNLSKFEGIFDASVIMNGTEAPHVPDSLAQ